MMLPHPTIDILVKDGIALVDVDIIPVVNWLNSFESVTTTGSCQGDNEQDCQQYPIDLPSVAFYCNDSNDLKSILLAIMEFGDKFHLESEDINKVPAEGIWMNVSLDDSERGSLEYTMGFANFKSREMFVRLCLTAKVALL